MQKTTEMLMNEIRSAKKPESFVEENKSEMLDMTLSEYLRFLLKQYGLDKSDVFKRAGMADNNYGYELFRNDEKKASREKLIRICIGFPLTIEEAQKVLRCGKVRQLYPRDERDAYILFALKNGYDIGEVNDLLYSHNLETFE